MPPKWLLLEGCAPVGVDIGGSFVKIVYWRPPRPPQLPDYIIRDVFAKESSSKTAAESAPVGQADEYEQPIIAPKLPPSRTTLQESHMANQVPKDTREALMYNTNIQQQSGDVSLSRVKEFNLPLRPDPSLAVSLSLTSRNASREFDVLEGGENEHLLSSSGEDDSNSNSNSADEFEDSSSSGGVLGDRKVRSSKRSPGKASADKPVKGQLRFLKFPSSKTPEFIEFLLATRLHEQYGEGGVETVNATGGGAYKYAEQVKERLGITFQKHGEMRSLIRGLCFLLLRVPEGEAFEYDWREHIRVPVSTAPRVDPAAGSSADRRFPFPFLLVNVGSGVSIVKVESEDKFERVSGSSIGGGTFWGLARTLTPPGETEPSWDDVRALCADGDNRNVDLVVGDIYGDFTGTLGLPPDIIASSFGKLASEARRSLPSHADMVRSLLLMISNNIAQIAYMNARLHNVQRVFFAGGFLQDNNYILSRLSYGVDFWSQGEMKAMFLRHNTYLGALGALIAPLHLQDIE